MAHREPRTAWRTIVETTDGVPDFDSPKREANPLDVTCPTAAGPRTFQHVLCVYPYRRELNSAGFCPPLGLECIAAVFEPHAKQMDTIDLRKEPGHTSDFLREETDMVCFSVNWDRDVEFWHEEILSVPPGIFTLVGGRHATEDPARWLAELPNVDAIVRGDGEEAVGELCRGVPLEEIAGLSYRKDGEIVHNPNRELGPVSDVLYPNRSARKYSYNLEAESISFGVKMDTVASSRGCPFNCAFCSFNRNPWGGKRKWSARSPESVVDELEQIDARVVAFVDDLFTHDMKRVERICELIRARGIRKKYIINARLEIARRPDVLKKMEQAGFTMLLLGIESAHDKTLKSMGKGFNTEQIRKYFDVLRGRPMLLHGYFILGNIGESVEEMGQTIPFAKELGVDTLALTMLRASPYSGLEELVADNPDYHIAENSKVYSDHCSIKELRHLRRRMYREFYDSGHVVDVIQKGFRIGALEFLPELLWHAPRYSWQFFKHYRRRAKRNAKRQSRKAVSAS